MKIKINLLNLVSHKIIVLDCICERCFGFSMCVNSVMNNNL